MIRPRTLRLALTFVTRLAGAHIPTGAAVFAAAIASSAAASETSSAADLNRLSIEDLANIDISSVSKTDQPLSDAPAAVFVITREDIHRAGAASIAEALRLAPNLQVARITASHYAISARGFNGSAADKLLVLVDGRSVYATYFSGVFWDVQDTPLDDIDRIEVISGPGATLWGANAVNGVINIITRKAGETQGGLMALSGGNRERTGMLQYGGKVGSKLSWRAYVSGVDYSHSITATGADAKDGWHKYQGGFRFDWTPSNDLITLQGDAYDGLDGHLTTAPEAIAGHNVIARWTHPFAGGSALQVQAYYDELRRDSAGNADDHVITYDLDMQHNLSLASVHQIVWGAGVRVINDDFQVTPQPALTQFFNPAKSALAYGEVFGQDSIALSPALKLILGIKLESDPYDGLQTLPSIRVSWKPADSALLWAAISRAVRAPSRLDRDFFETVGPTTVLQGGVFKSEKLTAFEAGYRGQPTVQTSLSVSAFYNIYDDLRSFEASPGGVLPLIIENMMEGETYGVEVWGSYQAAPWWRLSAGFDWLHKNLRFKPGSLALGGVGIAGDDPDYQASLQSRMELRPDLKLDVDLRNIGALPEPASPAYTELGVRLGWDVTRTVELSLTGTNLLHTHHAEFGSTGSTVQLGDIGVESGRRFSVDARWRF